MINAVRRLLSGAFREKPTAAKNTPQSTLADRTVFAPGHPVRNMEEGEIVWTDTPRYPAYDQGFPAASPTKLLDQHAKLMERLSLASTYDGRWSQNAILRVVQKYAAYVNCLPATYQENHYGAGGLLKLGLDVGFYSLQAANGVIFSNESADRRTVAEPRWKMATFIAGLTYELNRVISHILVTNEHGDQWHPFVETLSDWLDKTRSERFWVVWLKPTDAANQKALVSFILPKIIPDDVINYLAEDRRVLMLMNAAITGGMKMGDDNPILLLVGKVRYKVVEADLARNVNLLARPQIGSHLEPHIADAMRTLFATGTWEPNVKNGRLWATTEGVFLIWKTAAADIMGRLRRNNTPGMPQDLETMYDIMVAAKILTTPTTGNRFWRIRVKDAKSMIEAVKLANPVMFFGDLTDQIGAADFKLFDDPATTSANTPGPTHPSTDNPKPAQPKAAKAKKQLPQKPQEQPELPLESRDDGAATLSTAETKAPANPHPMESESSSDEPKESRTLARLQPPVADLLRKIREGIQAGTIKVQNIDDKAIGIPLKAIDKHAKQVPRLAVLTALSKEKALYTPPGQAKKIITLATESGEQEEFIGIARIYAKDIFGIG